MKRAAALICSLMVFGCGGAHRVRVPVIQANSDPIAHGASVPSESLETFMAKVRRASIDARPRSFGPRTIESADPQLAAALATAAVAPAPVSYRAVAAEYRRLGIFDRATQYLGRALALDAHDAAAYDARARLWRDSGLPHLALTDAYRAIFFAPESAVARNTLGTILQALGHRAQAREEYLRAIGLDSSAAYAFNNVCYTWTLDGEAERAIAACRRAVALQPDFAAAWNNLALAHASLGQAAEAEAAFSIAGDDAAALYNTGIVHLAHRQYDSAVKAFQAAHALRPTLTAAAARVAQATIAAHAAAE